MKGDRFEQMVERREILIGLSFPKPMVLSTTAITLLRKEHAAVVKMVEKDVAVYQGLATNAVRAGLNPECWDMRKEACLDILAALDKRAKGGTK